MTKDEIISLADDAGFSTLDDEYGGIQVIDSGNRWITDRILEFAQLIENATLEKAAIECEEMVMYPKAKQESAKHNNVWDAAKAIREMKK
jgi:hypothetical protein